MQCSKNITVICQLHDLCPHLAPADKVLPSVLQKAQVSLLSQTDCKKSYGPVSPRMLCAGVPSGEQDACRVSSHLTESPTITCI